ncbi:MAG TPA: polyprenyl synthetase family protein [Kofleriaceae bacterium]|nr:polyprenyl synthetase family protein [Kofleriaceae bacterium]
MTAAAMSIEATAPPMSDALDEMLEASLASLAGHVPRAVWERVLLAPARDILARPAKQLRAELVGLGAALAGSRVAPPAMVIGAIEMLHAGSLVIDDIEDGAEHRRGDVALHRLYGVPVALNAGNWMYFCAFALIDRAPVSDAVRAALHRAMLRAVLDCHAGQALDVGLDVTELPREQLRAIVERTSALKSGALTRLAAELGAIAGGASPERLAAIGSFGASLGLALQMLDDLGGVTCEHRLAKGCEDLQLSRPTWPWLWLAEHGDDALWTSLTRWGRRVAREHQEAELLARVIGEIVKLPGRAAIARQLAATRAAIRDLGATELATAVDAQLDRLAVAYV